MYCEILVTTEGTPVNREVRLIHSVGDPIENIFVTSRGRKWYLVGVDTNYDLMIDLLLPIEVSKNLLDWPFIDYGVLK